MSINESLRGRWLVVTAVVMMVIALSAPVGVALAGHGQPQSTSGNETKALDYLSEVGFGDEYGSSAPLIHKWTRDVNIGIQGTPTPADVDTLNLVVAELNSLLTGIELRLTDGAADMEVHFAPESSFAAIEPDYQAGNLGFFRVWMDQNGAIYRGRILIASDGITQAERSHLIREELTQSLGLFGDSWHYPDSIFYQGWTAAGEYASIDSPTIRLLYLPQLRPGMTYSQVQDLFHGDQVNPANSIERGELAYWRRESTLAIHQQPAVNLTA